MSEDAPNPPPQEPAPEPASSEAAPEPVAKAAPEPVAKAAPEPVAKAAPATFKPNYVFLAVVTITSLALDLGTKWWAKAKLLDPKAYQDRRVEVIPDHLAFTFAKNRGGAWGFLQDEPESVRRWFFLAVSALAVGFIVSLYRKLHPSQTALKWGLPLVLGGALGNLINRVQYQYVIDFIDFRADWVRFINKTLLRSTWGSDHWPTFNIADIAIVAGVVLMAIDMFTSRRETKKPIVGSVSNERAKLDEERKEPPADAPPKDAAPPADPEVPADAPAPSAGEEGEEGKVPKSVVV